MAFEPVAPVQAAPPTTGLVRSAPTLNDGARWQAGVAWVSERCPQASGFDPCGSDFTSDAGSGGNGIHYYRPVAFRVFDECATRIRDFDRERARRQANAVTSWMVARELEQGTISLANPYESPEAPGDLTTTNPFLAEASGGQIVAGGPYTPQVALGLLEGAARDAQLGMDPWLHVAPELIPMLGDAVERDAGLLRTKTGALIVSDAGYTGTGPLTGGTSEVQTITITGTPTGGSFRLTFQGQQTTTVPYNAAAATVRTALQDLPNLGPGDIVSVTGGPGPGTPYVVTFAARLGNVPTMTASHTFTGGTAPNIGVAQTTPGVAPAAAAGTWMYATDPVQVRLSDIEVLPDLVWSENRQYVIAQRLMAAYFDPCTLRAVQVAVPEPAA